ncbi:MAG: Uma2 family endonuclease [Thermoguttaceae bacterium]
MSTVARLSVQDYDLGEKACLYAAAGIGDYWVVDCRNRRVVVYREPGESGYRSTQEFAGKDRISPLSPPGVSLPVEVLFKPAA